MAADRLRCAYQAKIQVPEEWIEFHHAWEQIEFEESEKAPFSMPRRMHHCRIMN